MPKTGVGAHLSMRCKNALLFQFRIDSNNDMELLEKCKVYNGPGYIYCNY